jgi:diguanylate cyclase (GGDEF)-like protein
MHLMGQMDNWTLVVSIAIVTSMSAFAFGRVWQSQEGLRGSRSFAFAFLLGTISCFLFTLVPDSTQILRFFNTVVGDSLVLCVYALLLTGIEQFFAVRRVAPFAWILVGFAAIALWYFTFTRDLIVARETVEDLVTFLLRIAIGVELIHHPGRKHLRTLSGLMFIYAALSLFSIWNTLQRPGPRNASEWMHAQSLEQFSLFTTLVFFIAVSQLLFLILNGELVLQLKEEATLDFMTHTLNRRGSERALAAEMGRSQRFSMDLSIALVDVERFKQINDTLGHAEGDRILKLVAHSIQDTLRAYDSVGRFGGDEFVVILPNTPAAEAFKVMERVRQHTAGISAESATLSIGLTSMAKDESATALLSRVDQALYQAKQDGRNCTRLQLCAPDGQFLPQPSVLSRRKSHAENLLSREPTSPRKRSRPSSSRRKPAPPTEP